MGVLGKCCSEGLKISKTRLEDGAENSEKLSTVKKKKAKDKERQLPYEFDQVSECFLHLPHRSI